MMNRNVVVAVAILFATSTIAAVAHAEGTKCSGINSCKGQSACKTASSSCKGQNACKGQGWSEVSTPAECTSKGGKVL